MPSLPDSIASDFFHEAIELLDSGRESNFAESTVYDVMYDMRRYSPKALVGLAAELQEGEPYSPENFSGGLESKCFRLLEAAGFEIVLKDGVEPPTEPFIDAIRNANLSQKELGLVRCHYNAPDRIASSHWLATQLDIQGGKTVVNKAYGELAKRIGEGLPWNLPKGYVWVGYLVTFPSGMTGIPWKMHKGFAEALEILGLVDSNADLPFTEEIDKDSPCSEGAKRTITVNAYERSANARKLCLEHYGYRCAVCDVLLSDLYGPVAEQLIHVHHLRPISEIGQEYEVDPIEDLRPVCPNCHAVIHRRRLPRAFDIEEVKEFLRANR